MRRRVVAFREKSGEGWSCAGVRLYDADVVSESEVAPLRTGADTISE
jgi:hypothetical protein